MPEDQETPVDPSEYVLRGVLGRYVDASLDSPVISEAFSPSTRDIDGLSVFREKFVSADDVAAALGDEYYVARIPAQLVIEAGATLLPSVQPDSLPGHAIIPEIRRNLTGDAKRRMKEIRIVLARALTMNDLVRHAE